MINCINCRSWWFFRRCAALSDRVASAEETGKDRKEILTDFLCSKTGKALYDEKTKLWCNGPAYIAELYREELKKTGYHI